MSQTDHRAPSHDPRWEDHVPFSLRYNIVIERGDLDKFMTMLATRLHTLIEHEFGYGNPTYFISRLTTESLGRFNPERGQTYANMVYYYFSSQTVHKEVNEKVERDPEQVERFRLLRSGDSEGHAKAVAIEQATRKTRYASHWRTLISDRFEVLQSIFVLLQRDNLHDPLKSLIRDVRRFAADSGVLINVKGDPPTLVPLEEPLLQKEVLDRLLPRLEERFPERAADLIKAYHDVLKGVDTNTVFGNAFKALEQLARDISGNPKLELTKESELRNHFPKLHGTILMTITKLAAQRGDEGGHARLGPDEYEIRYLLFSICNVALLLLEHNDHCG